MKNIPSILLSVLLSASAANAASTHVSRVDLYATCVASENDKLKQWVTHVLTPAELNRIDPYQLKSISDGCACTVKQAFEYLTQDTIQAFNTSLKSGKGDIAPGKTRASMEFQKTGMMDKQIACNMQGLKSSGLQKKMDDLYKVKSRK